MIPFSSHNLVVESAQLQSSSGPRCEVVRNRNRTRTDEGRLLGDRDVLLESRGAGDGRLVVLLMFEDVVRLAVACDGAFRLDSRGALGVVIAVVLHDVVLHEGILGPAVD